MQTLQQELDPTPLALTPATHPVLRELMADPVTAYAEEVRVLRQRVALLEAELAATKAASVSEIQPDINRVARPAVSEGTSEFTECLTPAVRAVKTSQPVANEPKTIEPAPAQSEVAPSTEPVPNPGFAQAWGAEEDGASFEERVAERAFFQATTVDEESRTWLLTE